MLKELFLQWLSWRQAPKTSKNEILHFPGAITHRLWTHKPPICFHRCILMLYIVFDNFHALLANPIRQDILRGGPKIDVFVFFLTLEFEFLMTYEVSRPLHRRKPFIVIFTVFPSVSRDYISTSTGSLNFNSVCFPTLISKFSSSKLNRILSSHCQTIYHDIL